MLMKSNQALKEKVELNPLLDRLLDGWPAILIRLWQNQRSVIVICTAALTILGLTYLLIVPPRYTAIAGLVVDTRRSHPLGPDARPEALVDIAVVESQLETIRSERVASAVIRTLNLIEDPEYVPGGLFGAASDPPSHKLQRALAKFKRSLAVRRLGQSYVTEITFTSKDADKSARIANEVAKAYVQDQLDARIQQSRQAGMWLQGRIQELLQQMSDAFRNVETFKSENAAATREGQVKLRELEAHAETYKSIYEGFLSRFVQTIQQESFPVTDARIITEAMPPLIPSSPNGLLTLALALAAGVTLGLGVAFVRDQRGPRSSS